jgi:hypothetical protein
MSSRRGRSMRWLTKRSASRILDKNSIAPYDNVERSFGDFVELDLIYEKKLSGLQEWWGRGFLGACTHKRIASASRPKPENICSV